MRSKSCGSCKYWKKWQWPKVDGRGLCEKLDCAGKAEHGRGCRWWKGSPHKGIRKIKPQ